MIVSLLALFTIVHMTTINIQHMRSTDYISVQDSLEASLQDVFAVFHYFNIAT